MKILILSCVALSLIGCSSGHDQNDPYAVEETEVEYQPPAPYYDEQDY
ncbi:MAG: hypothetical protein V4489_06350 [Chlamydiota bacterium]